MPIIEKVRNEFNREIEEIEQKIANINSDIITLSCHVAKFSKSHNAALSRVGRRSRFTVLTGTPKMGFEKFNRSRSLRLIELRDELDQRIDW